MGYKKPEKDIQESTGKVKKLIETRGHIFKSGEYRNRKSVLVVFCPRHNQEVSTTFHNYERSRTGLNCCGNAQSSEKLLNRVFTTETLDRMKVAAQKRPFRGGKPRYWRKTAIYTSWRTAVIQKYDNKCAITGRSASQGQQDVHHLYSSKSYSHLIFVTENGILLCKELHILFHRNYGYQRNTLEQFLDFLVRIQENQAEFQSTLISSQANPEGLEGSETRAYDPERVMELHERLEGYKAYLKSIPVKPEVLDPAVGPINDSDSDSDSESESINE